MPKDLRLFYKLDGFVQLRTKKIGLRDFLFTQRVPGVTSSRCQCGERRQTVAHILLHCRMLKDLRNQVFDNLEGRHNLRAILTHYVSMLLESTGADFYIKPQRALVSAR
ncbi:predicted protein [Pyrenophora tritici-repentis Pt-1C-BFP]|uniref:Reverse transcriptase zinc-binding domain-containing protein n=1 Tax=Pyrenophora tritici-repentis (strain Pt-1C-BFP) TaxID=426418 RepID=B2W8B7_PYRTR|nr:uncharacterized protein PTRG_06225 [Pyrenophora tritici-repentis Pt-1C-BFP]EDU49145.1 predicted protein [Pyrenophora tritici-repentis Pt-1C-BFP]